MPNVCLIPDKDTSLNQNAATTNYDLNSLFMGLSYVAEYKNNLFRALMQWTIPAEVKVAEVYKAILCLGHLYSTCAPAAATIYRITQPAWVASQATWNNYKTGTAWAAAGGDYDSAGAHDHVHVTFPTGVGQWFEIDVTAMVIDAITNHTSNFDILLRLDQEAPATTFQWDWWNREGDPSYWRSFLNIVRPPFGRPREV